MSRRLSSGAGISAPWLWQMLQARRLALLTSRFKQPRRVQLLTFSASWKLTSTGAKSTTPE